MKRFILLALLVGCSTGAEAQVTTTTQVATTTTAPTTTTTSTTIPTATTTPLPDHQWLCPEWTRLAVQIGWPQEALPTLDLVMYRESRCNADSHNPSDPNTGSYGLVQVNGFWCQEWLQAQGILSQCSDLFDPAINLEAGLAIYNRSGWNPWSSI